MALSTIGTQVYFIDPGASNGPEVVAIDCVTSLSGLGAPREQVDVTCLEDQARQFIGGLATPGSMTSNINFDPQSPSHLRLHELYVANTKFDVAVALGDGTAAPTLDSNGHFHFPTTRTFVEALQSYVSDFPIAASANSVYQTAMTFQLSGFPTIFAKA